MAQNNLYNVCFCCYFFIQNTENCQAQDKHYVIVYHYDQLRELTESIQRACMFKIGR